MTTGVDIVGTLVREDPDIVAIVPIDRIKAGALPDDVVLPALLVRCVSSVDRQPLKRGVTTRSVDRISVTVRAASYRDQRALIGLLKPRVANGAGAVAGAQRVSILTAGTGPDVRGPGNSFEQTQDFRVSYDA
jgi:hypothetical protein